MFVAILLTFISIFGEQYCSSLCSESNFIFIMLPSSLHRRSKDSPSLSHPSPSSSSSTSSPSSSPRSNPPSKSGASVNDRLSRVPHSASGSSSSSSSPSTDPDALQQLSMKVAGSSSSSSASTDADALQQLSRKVAGADGGSLASSGRKSSEESSDVDESMEEAHVSSPSDTECVDVSMTVEGPPVVEAQGSDLTGNFSGIGSFGSGVIGSFGSGVSFLNDQNSGYEREGAATQMDDNAADETASNEDTVDAAVASPVEDEDPEVTLINSIDHFAFTPALLTRWEYRCNPYFARVGCTIEVFWYVDNEFYSAEVLQNNITALVVKFEIDNQVVDIYLANTIWYIKEPPSVDHPNPSCQEELPSLMEALQLYKANKGRCNVEKLVVNATFLYYEAFYGNWRRGTVKKVKNKKNSLFSVLDGIGPETHHNWCPYFYIWYFDELKKYDLGSKRSNPSSSITSIVAVSVGSSITSGTDVLDNKRLRTSHYAVMNSSSCNGSAPDMISKSDLNQACLASQNIEMRRLFKKVFCDGYQLPESQSERKKLYDNFMNMGLFKQQEPCYFQFCPGYVELPDGTSASASTITSPTLKSVAPEANHQTCVMLSEMKNESPLVTPGELCS